MVELQNRELLLSSLKGYLEDLLESGVDELLFDEESAAAPEPAAAAAGGAVEPSLRGVGNPNARLLFVLTGAGFSGPSGELFAKIVKAMGFGTEEVFLLSFGSGASASGELLRTSLLERIAAVAPGVVVALGEPAARVLLQSREPIGKLRGRFHDLQGIPLMATLHPDQLLADESLKRELWNEMKQVMSKLADGG